MAHWYRALVIKGIKTSDKQYNVRLDNTQTDTTIHLWGSQAKKTAIFIPKGTFVLVQKIGEWTKDDPRVWYYVFEELGNRKVRMTETAAKRCLQRVRVEDNFVRCDDKGAELYTRYVWDINR